MRSSSFIGLVYRGQTAPGRWITLNNKHNEIADLMSVIVTERGLCGQQESAGGCPARKLSATPSYLGEHIAKTRSNCQETGSSTLGLRCRLHECGECAADCRLARGECTRPRDRLHQNHPRAFQ